MSSRYCWAPLGQMICGPGCPGDFQGDDTNDIEGDETLDV